MKSYPTPLSLPLIPDREPKRAWHPFAASPAERSIHRAPQEAILHRAYAIWEREGHPANRQLANWLDAETELRGRPASWTLRHAVSGG